MELILSVAIIISFIIILITIYFISVYNKYQEYIIRITEAETQIDESLKKKFELLNRSISIIKANADVEEDILEDIVKLRSRKLNNLDLDSRLTTATNEFHEVVEKYNDYLLTSESFSNLCFELTITEEQLSSTKIYFNNVINQYNKLIKIFPSNIVGKLFKYKEKVQFPAKSTYDDIYNDFKI